VTIDLDVHVFHRLGVGEDETEAKSIDEIIKTIRWKRVRREGQKDVIRMDPPCDECMDLIRRGVIANIQSYILFDNDVFDTSTLLIWFSKRGWERDSSSTPTCGTCGTSSPHLQACVCRLEMYCDAKCQRAAWRNHRGLCRMKTNKFSREKGATYKFWNMAKMFDDEKAKTVPVPVSVNTTTTMTKTTTKATVPSVVYVSRFDPYGFKDQKLKMDAFLDQFQSVFVNMVTCTSGPRRLIYMNTLRNMMIEHKVPYYAYAMNMATRLIVVVCYSKTGCIRLMSDDKKFCSACDRSSKTTGTMAQCACGLEWYCDAECQRVVWPAHKEMCRVVRKVMDGGSWVPYAYEDARSSIPCTCSTCTCRN